MHTVTVADVPQGVQLIDVREPDEYATAHAAGAINIPMSQFVTQLAQVDTSRPVYLICQAGGRSAHCAEYLEQAVPQASVYNVSGGTQAWLAAGLPTE
ncbi:rhodanese-like domain-containing protein [Corynebacterium uberis]|uniref:rhodanese-like domain-containing protein n=1 Tax=Corynebacterium TaxID=1716 RepID=UPI001D0B6B35|nr:MULTISPECIES: rhodanese-like domain-containing protein [Corynebacterium]MCZ9309739.1 rhodanese-like domain-containing protein [Corynebacterium sp. c6VSa_13]UDL73543.1 rhodanese-like domain-containing protein [Corynebacterium uberis]UDL75577.1 rhodanese-like domain-containing protein [Corynebacterium uberis]UDL77790.1 rhodanese-like domain-containing protein [Corynebacterium uberis]UDL80073.1 rhodanese-like domain-containing protein [Corynebacterium uberis]